MMARDTHPCYISNEKDSAKKKLLYLYISAQHRNGDTG
ncbi:UNVERIFIED_ORG: hypothetical protein J2806_002570 [Kosakonia oryzae]|nr:hypothetical protein [Kosakonia oryzae]